MLRPKKADTVNEIENRLNGWQEKQRSLVEVWEAPLQDDIMEDLLKSAAMRSDDEGACEDLGRELLEYLAMIDQQNRKASGNLNPVAQGRSHQPPGGANERVHRALVG